MHQLIQNDFVQLAVILSGIITLLVLTAQGVRYIVLPLLFLLRNGFAKNKEIKRRKFEDSILRSVNSNSYLTNAIFIHVIRLLNSIFGFITAATTTILASFLYVPGYKENAVGILLVDMPNDVANIVSTVFAMLAAYFFFAALFTAMRFAIVVNARLIARVPEQ